MRATEKRTGRQESVQTLAAEVRRLRRDIDLLGVMHKLDELTRRVSRLEFAEERRQN